MLIADSGSVILLPPMSPIFTSVLLGLTAAAANVFGGAVIVQKSWERRYLRYFVALGAGFMLATALVEMVPESLELAGRKGALLVLLGYLLVHLFEHTITPHFQLRLFTGTSCSPPAPKPKAAPGARCAWKARNTS